VTTTRVSFTFESSRNNSTFKCSMDGAAWVACTSPRSYGRLADGPHTFRVKAKNDTLVDETPASRSFTVHSGAPSVTIKGGPGSATTSSTVTFSFYADEDNVTFQCRLDSNPWVSCSSPYTTYAGSANHQHVFKVRATDSDGNTGLPASYDYTRFA
jgi:hypothetical protein